MKKALITGCCGQDGSYLAEHLLRLGYEVHGLAKGLCYENVTAGVTVHVGDLRDAVGLENIFRKVWPNEVYNLGGQVFVPTSWRHSEETFDVNVGGLTRLLEIVDRLKQDTKVYQASSSEMFGNVGGVLNEHSPMHPVSPYGVSKLAAHHMVHVYRAKDLYVVSGILFNHESPRRGEHMVTRKITRAVAKWAMGDECMLELGNPEAARDWGEARDYVRAMHLMMQQQEPDDYVVGTGTTHTVNEFLLAAVESAGLQWPEVASFVRYNAKAFTRQNELHTLKADAAKAKIVLGWAPQNSFEMLVGHMVHADIQKEHQRIKIEESV
jgi:GDPmannose 4,6-dehydratase